MILLDAGSFGDAPWWAFLMMPVMMLGMGLMMWFMMRMMMGMGGHGPSHGSTDSPAAARGEQVADSEVSSLRQQVAELQQRLAAMESKPRGQDHDDKPPSPSSEEMEGRRGDERESIHDGR